MLLERDKTSVYNESSIDSKLLIFSKSVFCCHFISNLGQKCI